MNKMRTTIKEVSQALLLGLRLSYRGEMRERQRQKLYDLLDDIAVSLTSLAIEEQNVRFAHYAALLGELGDQMNLPIPKEQRDDKQKSNGRRHRGH